jgi:hypothetical protein
MTMTSSDLTRSLIYLDLNDMDGLIDIARYGVAPMATNPKTRQLIQQLANGIVSWVIKPWPKWLAKARQTRRMTRHDHYLKGGQHWPCFHWHRCRSRLTRQWISG